MWGVQEYMVKLLGRYREFVERDAPGSPGPPAVPEANGSGPRSRHQDDGYIRQASHPCTLLRQALQPVDHIFSLEIVICAIRAGVYCLMTS